MSSAPEHPKLQPTVMLNSKAGITGNYWSTGLVSLFADLVLVDRRTLTFLRQRCPAEEILQIREFKPEMAKNLILFIIFD